jgi:hypothetical protein
MSEKKFKPVTANGGGTLEFIRPAQLAKDGVTGEILEGVYVESLPNQIDDEKLDYKFQTEDGRTIIVNGAGNLPYQMNKVMPGTLVRLNYGGKTVIQKGPRKGKKAHNFTVLVEAE